MKVAKLLFANLRNFFRWHLYPTEKELSLKSVVETLFYLCIVFALLHTFKGWNKIEDRTIVMSMEYRNNNKIIPDSIVKSSMHIAMIIPMTNRVSDKEQGSKIHIKTNESIDSTKSYNIKSYEENMNNIIPSYTDFKNIEDTIASEFSKDSHKYLISNFIEHFKYDDRLGNIFRFIYGYSRNTQNSFNQKSESHFYDDNNLMALSASAPKDYHVNDIILSSKKQSNEYLGTIGHGGELSGPNWFRYEDISQTYYNIKILDCNVDSLSLRFDFVGVTEFSNMIPEPDVKGVGFIEFHKTEKISQIKENGLQFHAKYKELENMQNMRLFAITAILGGVMLIFIAFLFVMIINFAKWYKNHKIIGSIIVLMILLLYAYYFKYYLLIWG